MLLLVIPTLIGLALVGLLIYDRLTSGDGLKNLRGKHVLITGGSKGIGFELAKLAVQSGASVTIVARNGNDLESAKLNLIMAASESKVDEQKILAYSVDVGEKVEVFESIVSTAEGESGPIYLLACCAGSAISKRFEDTSVADFERMMRVNYFGSVNTVKACLSSLKANPGGGRILFFSSLAGIFGLYGYAAYSASKFAVVGLAEVLAMELLPHNITVTVSFPPDTDTPGFKLEQVGKPQITKIISEEGGLFPPNEIAKRALLDSLQGEFISTNGMNGHVLTTLCSGMMPTKSWSLAAFQVLFAGLLRVIGLHFLNTCSKSIKKYIQEEKKETKKD